MPIVSGRVIERWTRRPVSGVIVKIGQYTALTDAMGRFSIDPPTGSIQITLTHRGFQPYTMSLNLLRETDIGEISLDSRIVALS